MVPRYQPYFLDYTVTHKMSVDT